MGNHSVYGLLKSIRRKDSIPNIDIRLKNNITDSYWLGIDFNVKDYLNLPLLITSY